MEASVGVRHAFDLTLRIRPAPLEDRLILCNALDGYEVERGLAEILVLDVVECHETEVVVRFTPMRPLTYKSLNEYIRDMMEFVGEQTNWRLDVEAVGIKWEVAKYGVPSERFDRGLLLSHPKRQEILDRLGVAAGDVAGQEHQTGGHAGGKWHLAAGKCYALREPRPRRAFEVLADQTQQGLPALVVTRLKPSIIREQFGLKRTPILWLTGNDHKEEKCLAPTEIAKLHLVLTDFLEKTKDAVVLLDGLEYLISNNSFATILKLVQHVTDRVMLHDGRLIVSLAPESITEKELALFERDMERLD